MSSDDSFIHGLIAPNDSGNPNGVEQMTYETLDDIFYNIIHDIVLQVHREEKILRANSAAIAIEDLAANNPAGDRTLTQTPTKSPAKSPKSPHGPRWRTEAAININGDVHLLGNPLKTQPQILCPKCRLPQWLDPPLGREPPDLHIKYCPRRPVVNIPGHDVHGVPFPHTDAKSNSRKRQKKDMSTVPLGSAQNSSQTLPNTQEPTSFCGSPSPPTPPEDATNTNAAAEKKKKPPKKESYPEVTCKRCGYRCAVNIYGRHLSKCMGIGGRASGRAAALKMNGEANGGSRGTSTPPGSRRSTPLPPGAVKRAADSIEDEDDEDDYKEKTPKKKRRRRKPGPKKMAMPDPGRPIDTTLAPMPQPQSRPFMLKLKIRKESTTEVKPKDQTIATKNESAFEILPPPAPRDPSSESTHTMSSAL